MVLSSLVSNTSLYLRAPRMELWAAEKSDNFRLVQITRANTWACFDFFVKRAVYMAAIQEVANKLLMTICHCFGDVPERLYSVC